VHPSDILAGFAGVPPACMPVYAITAEYNLVLLRVRDLRRRQQL